MTTRQLAFILTLFPTVALTPAGDLHAQGRVIVVDSDGGPGVDFTDLAPAVEAAAPGDILDVVARNGYLGFSTDKGIHLFGRTPVRLFGGFGVTNLPANQTFTLRNFTTFTFSQASNSVADCAGTVVLDEVVSSGMALGIFRSPAVHGYRVSAPFRIVDSTVALDHSFGAGIAFATSSEPGIVIERSTLTMANTSVVGASGIFAPPAVGIQSAQSQITATGAPGVASIQAGQGSFSGAATSGISGTGTLTLDPMVVVNGALGGLPIEAGIAVTNTSVPAVSTAGTSIGGILRVDLTGPGGEAYFLAVGLMSPTPQTVPGLLGEFWLQLPSLAQFGVLDATGATAFSAPVPNAAEIVGLQFATQAVTAFGVEDLRFSNPAVSTFRF